LSIHIGRQHHGNQCNEPLHLEPEIFSFVQSAVLLISLPMPEIVPQPVITKDHITRFNIIKNFFILVSH